jgi:radical SAM superfamily enzyme YgiQ (UPF0313 family)
MKRMVLVHPYPDKHFGEENVSVIVQAPLNLGYVAAMTPRDEWEVELVDETREKAVDEHGNPTFGHADVVGLTGLTYQAPRAYEIAAACRRAGIPTMAGGCHATIAPDEVGRHVDAVLVGEAELVYPKVLEDLRHGRLQRRYDGGPTPLHQLKGVVPDREWLRQKYNYRYSSIVTTRGCPFKCDFCSVPTIQGRKYRERPPEDVWEELAATSYRGLMLAEDNFYGYTPAAQERCHRLFKGWAERKLQKDWFGFTSLNVTQDPVVLDYMAASGCLGFLMGIESLDFETLKQMHKSVNIGIAKRNNISIQEAYRESFKNVHDRGMIVWGSVIFGSDFDTPDTFKQIADAVWDTKMDVCTFGIYTPMPDTELFHRLSKEQRIFRTSFPEDWYYYNSGHLVFRLKTLTLDQYIDGLTHVYRSIYTPEALRERYKRTLAATGNLKSATFAYRVGLDWKVVFEANLHELHALRESGRYPHLPRADRVVVPDDVVAAHPQEAKLRTMQKSLSH